VAEAISSTLAGKRIVIRARGAERGDGAGPLGTRSDFQWLLPLVSFATRGLCAAGCGELKGIEEFDWMILTSAQAVRALCETPARS